MPDYGFGRCDGHHEMNDFKLRKKPRFGASDYDERVLAAIELAGGRVGDHFRRDVFKRVQFDIFEQVRERLCTRLDADVVAAILREATSLFDQTFPVKH
jgi:hypothetical protein